MGGWGAKRCQFLVAYTLRLQSERVSAVSQSMRVVRFFVVILYDCRVQGFVLHLQVLSESFEKAKIGSASALSE